jgi:hypothetical protein
MRMRQAADNVARQLRGRWERWCTWAEEQAAKRETPGADRRWRSARFGPLTHWVNWEADVVARLLFWSLLYSPATVALALGKASWWLVAITTFVQPLQIAIAGVLIREWAGALDYVASRFERDPDTARDYKTGELGRWPRRALSSRKVLWAVLGICAASAVCLGVWHRTLFLWEDKSLPHLLHLAGRYWWSRAAYLATQYVGAIYLGYAAGCVVELATVTRVLLRARRQGFRLLIQPPWLGLDRFRDALGYLSGLVLTVALFLPIHFIVTGGGLAGSGQPPATTYPANVGVPDSQPMGAAGRRDQSGPQGSNTGSTSGAGLGDRVWQASHRVISGSLIGIGSVGFFLYLVELANAFLRWGKAELQKRHDRDKEEPEKQATLLAKIAEIRTSILSLPDGLRAYGALAISVASPFLTQDPGSGLLGNVHKLLARLGGPGGP